MKMMFCVKDEKANTAAEPFTSANRMTAIRSIRDGLRSNEELRNNAADYSLWAIGSWENDRLALVGHDAEFVIAISDLLEEF